MRYVLSCLLVVLVLGITSDCCQAQFLPTLHYCQLPLPIYYHSANRPDDCAYNDVDMILQAIDIYNDAAAQIGLPVGFFYYAGTTDEAMSLCDSDDNTNYCPYANYQYQITWIDKSSGPVGRMCSCPLGDGFEVDVILNRAHNSCEDEENLPFGMACALTTLLHEFGHVLGLADQSTGNGSIMIGVTPSACQDWLSDGDILNLSHLWDPFATGNIEITNVNTVSTFDPVTYTWDVELTFDTNIPTNASVSCDQSMDCYPPCEYDQTFSETPGYYLLNHSVTLEDLPASSNYCYEITALGTATYIPRPGCNGTFESTFSLNSGLGDIYDINYFVNEDDCRIHTSWKTEFPSKDNRVFWRKTGDIIWNVALPEQSDCSLSRYYLATFPVEEKTSYEFYISTWIDGVMTKTLNFNLNVGKCSGGSGPPGPIRRGREIGSADAFAYPNPFNPATTINYYLPEMSHVSLDIYNVAGELVSRLVNEKKNQGWHSVSWNGVDSSGEHLSSGVYFYKLSTGNKTVTKKMVLLR